MSAAERETVSSPSRHATSDTLGGNPLAAERKNREKSVKGTNDEVTKQKYNRDADISVCVQQNVTK